MNYELAKKLKDAGFPNSDKWNLGNPYSDGSFDWFDGEKPTLSELIEACGNGFNDLAKINNEWMASSATYENSYMATTAEIFLNVGNGKTPEEAVANLWLELNKN